MPVSTILPLSNTIIFCTSRNVDKRCAKRCEKSVNAQQILPITMVVRPLDASFNAVCTWISDSASKVGVKFACLKSFTKSRRCLELNVI
jgi:hypothetical protein